MDSLTGGLGHGHTPSPRGWSLTYNPGSHWPGDREAVMKATEQLYVAWELQMPSGH